MSWQKYDPKRPPIHGQKIRYGFFQNGILPRWCEILASKFGQLCLGQSVSPDMNWEVYWSNEEEIAPTQRSPQTQNCKCGIYCGDCIYHRDDQ